MSDLHQALAQLSPTDYADVPLDNLPAYVRNLFSSAELIANSVPLPPNGTPYESAKRSRSDPTPAVCAADLTVSQVRRPVSKDAQDLHKAWGKPLKLSAKDQQTGISVYKMAGNDRHGAWFARASVHEGLGFAKWKSAMMREFPESLETEGGPGVGSVRGIGGDRRLEDIEMDGVGKMEVYQLSAQFPGPTAAREFITLLLTSDNCLGESSKVNGVIPRHYMVVSIPVQHPDAPPRNGFVRGQYESVEMIREIPLAKPSSTDENDSDGSETNPVEWIMITRSDPGGGIPRFMVERGTPGSIVQDAGKFLDWACAREDFEEETGQDVPRHSIDEERRFSIANSNGLSAGVGTSIADRPSSVYRRASPRDVEKEEDEQGLVQTMADTLEPYIPNALNPMRRDSFSSSTTSSSDDSFASAEQFATASDGLTPYDSIPTSSTASEQYAAPLGEDTATQSRELQKIEQKRQQLHERLEAAKQKQTVLSTSANDKPVKELGKVDEKHNRNRKKQEDKFAKEVRKLERRRERETKKLLARQQKEAEKNNFNKTLKERDEWKMKFELAEKEMNLLREQIGELQSENTLLVSKLGKLEGGTEVLKTVQEELKSSSRGRKRAVSKTSSKSEKSRAGLKASSFNNAESVNE